MPKRRRSPVESAPAKPAGRWTRPDIKHTSVYLPEAAYEALRRVAFDERRKIHDLLIEGVELALKEARISSVDRDESQVAAEGTVRSAVAELPMSAR
jgi:hypothetical protein